MKLPEHDREFVFEVVSDDDMPDEYAVTLKKKKKIIVRESVYYGACDGNERDRFTIAHEVGHYLMHSKQSLRLARSSRKIKTYEDPEWQANTFAAEVFPK